jgi:hypothetical protein
MPLSLRPVLELLLEGIVEVHEGQLEPQKASAMAALASASVKVFTTGQLEERLEALERAANPRRMAS